MSKWMSWLRARWSYTTLAAVLLALAVAVLCGANGHGCLYAGGFAVFVFLFRPCSRIYRTTMETTSSLRVGLSLLLMVGTVAACILPMGRLPLWNGEDPGHRDQYERMAEALLDGRVYLEYGDEEGLSRLDNPYDPEERKAAGVPYQWDHAFYEGRYYMYFGIVPVVLVFLPYRAVTGAALATYHATQLFVAATVLGLFALLRLLCRRFFPQLPYAVYLALAVAFSGMSVWYAVAEPALYCTAITAALALEVWSLYFFVKAVWVERRENRQLLLAAVGALLGALVFGCRPTVGLANLLVVPMLVAFLRQRPVTARLCGKLLLAALPYGAVATGLMWYNYIRFDNVLEFGQAYQLTVADQSRYGFSWSPSELLRLYNGTVKNFFDVSQPTAVFPYVQASSVVYNFPILLLFGGLLRPSVSRSLREKSLLWLPVGTLLVAVAITTVSVMWTPYLMERYRMDIYFLLAVGCFVAVGARYSVADAVRQARLCAVATVLSGMTAVTAFLLYARTVGGLYPEELRRLAELLHLGGEMR